MIAVCLLSLLLGSDWSCTVGAAGPLLLALFLLLLLGLLGLLLGSDWFSAAGAVRPSGLLLRLGRSIIVRTFQAATVSFLKLWFLFFGHFLLFVDSLCSCHFTDAPMDVAIHPGRFGGADNF